MDLLYTGGFSDAALKCLYKLHCLAKFDDDDAAVFERENCASSPVFLKVLIIINGRLKITLLEMFSMYGITSISATLHLKSCTVFSSTFLIV